jgi:hypothetical protein
LGFAWRSITTATCTAGRSVAFGRVSEAIGKV